MLCSMTWRIAASLGALVPLACTVYDTSCKHSRALEPQTAQVAQGESMRIDVESGSLVVEVVPDLTEVRVSGEACSSDLEQLSQVELTIEHRDGVLHLASAFPDISHVGFGLDLVVQMPAGIPVRVKNGSGSISIKGVAGVDIEDGSGSIELVDIQGDVRIDDGSGSLSLSGVTGNVWIEDGSGSIEVRQVGGSLTVEEDGSGSIAVESVQGDVIIMDDGSGSIDVREVGGDFTVDEDGSGDLEFSGVKGRVTLPDG